MKVKVRDSLKLVFAILLCEGVGLLSAALVTPSIPTWYAALTLPAFSPPRWVFAPVWLSLYALMGVAAFIVWQKQQKVEKNEVGRGLWYFALQLGLNALWTFFFFGLHNVSLAFLDILFLWLCISITMRAFWRVSGLAAVLLAPYLLWVSFAAYLNGAILLLNS